MPDEHLAVAVPAPAPIPIVGIAERRGDPRRDRRGNRLEHEREAAGRLERERVRRAGCAAAAVRPCALKPPSIVAVCGVSPMWPITGMPAPTIARHARERGPAPSSLTASAPPSLTKRIAFSTRLLVRHLVRAERQVGDDERPAARRAHGARQHEHLVQRHRHRRRRGRARPSPPSRRRAQVDAGLVGEPAARRVVGGHHHDLLAARASSRRAR